MPTSDKYRNSELRVPREQGLVCVITWPASKQYAMCFGCGWQMDRPSLDDIHEHITDPGFTRIQATDRFFYFLDANGENHRDNGPAAISKGRVTPGTGEWYKHGKLHREDGPAVRVSQSYPSFDEWWYEGEKLSCDRGVDEYQELREALEDHEYSELLLAKLDALVAQSVISGLVRGAQSDRVD